MSYDPDARRDTPLAMKLKEQIRKVGFITIDRFMDACLQNDQHGYYSTQTAIGKTGDFITAPEISQAFGELIGLWCAVVWQQMGSPSRFDLVEAGPGRGTLMMDALRACRVVPGFLQAAHVRLIESNPVLREMQNAIADVTGVKIEHVDEEFMLEKPSIIIGNEFLDTEPVFQYVLTERGFAARIVTLDSQDHLQFETSHFLAGGDVPALPVGTVKEVADYPFVDLLVAHKYHEPSTDVPVAALFLDYGYTGMEYGDTLQAVRAHKFEHPLTSPGEADLTALVSFSNVARRADQRALAVDGPVTQAEFLGSLGIMERASRLMAANPARANEIEMGVARLMNPQGMGTRFKAIGIRSPHLPPLPGFPL